MTFYGFRRFKSDLWKFLITVVVDDASTTILMLGLLSIDKWKIQYYS